MVLSDLPFGCLAQILQSLLLSVPASNVFAAIANTGVLLARSVLPITADNNTCQVMLQSHRHGREEPHHSNAAALWSLLWTTLGQNRKRTSFLCVQMKVQFLEIASKYRARRPSYGCWYSEAEKSSDPSCLSTILGDPALTASSAEVSSRRASTNTPQESGP